MTRQVKKPDHISQEDWDSVDIPPLTDEQLARLRPAREIFPNIDEFPQPKSKWNRDPKPPKAR
jgi:hypothetical protein